MINSMLGNESIRMAPKGKDLMKRAFRPTLVVMGLALIASSAGAHYNMLLPQAASVKQGDAVTFLYLWGHPFEHQLFDAPAPQSVVVLAPDGQKTDLSKTLEKVTMETAEAKAATAYRFDFTPRQRGDFLFLLSAAPLWMEEEQEFLQDSVKVVLH